MWANENTFKIKNHPFGLKRNVFTSVVSGHVKTRRTELCGSRLQPFSLHQEPSDRTFERQLLLLLRSYMKYIISCAAAALALMMPLES